MKLLGFCLWVALLTVSTIACGQGNVVRGTLVDSLTKLPIPYATVRCPQLGKVTAADSEGEFVLDAEGHDELTISVSCVGYYSKLLSAKAGESKIVQLVSAYVEIDEIIIMPSKPSIEAKRIVKAAFDNLNKNSGAFTATADLRHAVKENGVYVKLLDAELFFQEDKNYKGNLRPEYVQEQLTYLQKRESLDFSMDRLDFQRSYFDFNVNEFAFLLKNGLKYSLTSRNYEYFIEQKEEFENESRYVISAFDKTIIKANKYYEIFDLTYEIFVDKQTNEHFIKSYELNYKSSMSRKHLKHVENSFFRIEMQKLGKTLVPEFIDHFVVQSTKYDSLSPASQVEASHHIGFRNVTQRKVAKPEKNIQYRSVYWQKIPITDDLKQNLSSLIELERQFETQHIQPEKQSNQEKVSKKLIDNFIETNKSKNVYLVLWDKPESLLSFLNSPDIFDHTKTRLVFIGAVDNLKQWAFIISGSGMMFYPQFNLSILYKSYIQEKQILPQYILIKQGSNPIYKGQPIDLTEINRN